MRACPPSSPSAWYSARAWPRWAAASSCRPSRASARPRSRWRPRLAGPVAEAAEGVQRQVLGGDELLPVPVPVAGRSARVHASCQQCRRTRGGRRRPPPRPAPRGRWRTRPGPLVAVGSADRDARGRRVGHHGRPGGVHGHAPRRARCAGSGRASGGSPPGAARRCRPARASSAAYARSRSWKVYRPGRCSVSRLARVSSASRRAHRGRRAARPGWPPRRRRDVRARGAARAAGTAGPRPGSAAGTTRRTRAQTSVAGSPPASASRAARLSRSSSASAASERSPARCRPGRRPWPAPAAAGRTGR